jgi:sulfide:quinone oxidoreductase
MSRLRSAGTSDRPRCREDSIPEGLHARRQRVGLRRGQRLAPRTYPQNAGGVTRLKLARARPIVRLMQPPEASSTGYRVVIVGAGVAGLEAALALRQLAGERASVTVLAPDDEYVDRPSVVREPFGGGVAHHYPLDRVVAGTGAGRCVDSFKWIAPEAQTIHTEGGLELRYDAALIAVGARRIASLRHALTLDERCMDEQLHGLVQDVEQGFAKSVAFVVPCTRCWPLPAYELALMTARRAHEMNVDVRVVIVTPESAPLAVFGPAVTSAVAGMLSTCGIEVISETSGQAREPGKLVLSHNRQVREFDRIVALPKLYGAALAGLARTARDGFLSVDRNGRVTGAKHVYAAGDTTDFPVKFGSIAALQADAAAAAIAVEAGAQVQLRPLVPVVHGILLGGQRPLYLRARISDGHGQASEVSDRPFVDTPAKVEAKYLGPYLDTLRQRTASGVRSG